jgi:hypothetical protein
MRAVIESDGTVNGTRVVVGGMDISDILTSLSWKGNIAARNVMVSVEFPASIQMTQRASLPPELLEISDGR